MSESEVQIVSEESASYPKNLLRFPGMPQKLWMKGQYLPNDANAVSVVGSRKMTPRAEKLCREFTAALVQENFTIVSGLARGIDSVAHEVALADEGRTIAVVGSGIDIVYPPENKGLFEKIIENGCVITQFKPGTPPYKWNFKERNAVVAGLAKRAVLVIEGQLPSGTINTARWAADMGLEVCAVPGSPATELLISEGATAVNTPQDLVDYVISLDS